MGNYISSLIESRLADLAELCGTRSLDQEAAGHSCRVKLEML